MTSENSEEKTYDRHGKIPDSSPSKIEGNKESVTDEQNHQNSESLESLEVSKNDLTKKTEEYQVLNDKYLRLAAEFENYKRRAQRDQSETAKFANEKLLKDLLPTIDNLERAIKCGREQSTGEGLIEGVELTYKQFLDTLTKLGVSQITSIGEPFDPSKHQAVAQVPSNTIAPNMVLEEFQKGYFLHDRILRPAMVSVATTKTDEESSKGDKNPEEGGGNA